MTDNPAKIDMEQFFVPPRKETLAANVAAQIKSLIFRKKLQPGHKLPPERELAGLFKVSRVVIKQALLSLEHSGFVEIRIGSKGGAYVKFDFNKPITIILEDLQKNGDLRISHFQDVRRALELAALDATLDSVEIDLQKVSEVNQVFGQPENRARHAELNIAFHLALTDLAGNPLIKILLSSIMEMVFSYPGPTISTQFINKAFIGHEKIIAAVRLRDRETARRLLLDNIELVSNKNL